MGFVNSGTAQVGEIYSEIEQTNPYALADGQSITIKGMGFPAMHDGLSLVAEAADRYRSQLALYTGMRLPTSMRMPFTVIAQGKGRYGRHHTPVRGSGSLEA